MSVASAAGLCVRRVHQRDEHGDRADGEGHLGVADGLERDGGVEPVRQDQWRSGEQRQGHVPDRAGDVEERRDAQDHVIGPDADPVAVGLGVEDDVAVRRHRALRRAGGARRVRQEGHIVRGGCQGGWLPGRGNA